MKIYQLGKYEKLLNNPESVYLLGLLWSDGYLGKTKGTSYSVCLRLNTDDFQLIEPLMTEEWGNWKIFNYKKPQDKPTWKNMRQGMINSRELCIFLEMFDFHLKSSKGPSLILETIPTELKHYFLRGLTDGDGCFYIRKGGGGSSFSLAGSYDFDWTFLNEFNTNFLIKRIKVKTGKSSTARLDKRAQIVAWGNLIYQGIPLGLGRKYKKYLEIKRYYEEKLEPLYFIDVISPEGKLYTITNCSDFAKTHKLHPSLLYKLVNKKCLSCGGWRLAETKLEDFQNRRSNGGKEYNLKLNGEILKIKNLSKFCRENNVSRNGLKLLVVGKISQYKGYTLA